MCFHKEIILHHNSGELVTIQKRKTKIKTSQRYTAPEWSKLIIENKYLTIEQLTQNMNKAKQKTVKQKRIRNSKNQWTGKQSKHNHENSNLEYILYVKKQEWKNNAWNNKEKWIDNKLNTQI